MFSSFSPNATTNQKEMLIEADFDLVASIATHYRREGRRIQKLMKGKKCWTHFCTKQGQFKA